LAASKTPPPHVDLDRAARAVAELLRALGHAPEARPDLAETPERVAEAWAGDLLDGTTMDPRSILAAIAGDTRELAVSSPSIHDLVVVTGLPLAGMCAHHLLPFHGVAHVAYRPTGKVTGLSCLGRLVDCFAHRLTIQEQVGREVTDALIRELGAAGAACVLDAQHTCMIARGPRQSGARVTTVSLAGTMQEGGPDHALLWAALRIQGTPRVGGHE
jgi:GTP cyclohydrolase I